MWQEFDDTRDRAVFGRCTIALPQAGEPGEPLVCIIAIADDWVRAELAVEAGDQDVAAERARLLAFFRYLDENWRGWSGTHTWFDTSCRIGLVATNEAGLITLAAQLSSSMLTQGGPWLNEDFVQVSTQLDAAHVQRLVPRLEALLS